MSDRTIGRPFEVLMVEDNPGDVRLTIEALRENGVPNNLHAVGDGEEALAFLRRESNYGDVPRPDIILLDLTLPKKGGREVLMEIKTDRYLRRIPVVVLSISQSAEDINIAYDLGANCYVVKPVDLEEFIMIVKSIKDFWLSTAQLPTA